MPVKKSGTSTLMACTSGEPSWVKYTSQRKCGAALARPARSSRWYTFFGSRRSTRSIETFASAVSISMIVFACFAASAGLAPASSSILPTWS